MCQAKCRPTHYIIIEPNKSVLIIIIMMSSPMQWTTDEDLTEAIRSVGITDVLEIKFFENRANGQSKG